MRPGTIWCRVFYIGALKLFMYKCKKIYISTVLVASISVSADGLAVNH